VTREVAVSFYRACVGAATAAAFVNCGEPATPVPEPLDARITITPDSLTAWVLDTVVVTLQYQGLDRDSLMKLPVSWSASDTALVDLLDGAGPVARLVPRRAGQVFVTARVGDASDTAQVVGWEEGESLIVREWAASTLTFTQSVAVGADGRVHLLRYENAILAFDGDLTPAWETPRFGPGWMNVAIADDGSVIVPSAGGLVALSPAGVLLWEDTTFSTIESAPAVDTRGHVWLGGRLDQGSSPATYGIAHYDPTGVRVAFTGTLTVKVPPVIVRDSVVVIGDLGARAFGISRRDSILWVDTLPSPLRYFAPSVAGDGRTVYLPTRDGPVIALDGLTGDSLWVWDGAGIPTSPLVDADGVIYVQTAGSLVALEPDGSVRWRADSLDNDYGVNRLGAPALAGGGVLYVACKTDLCAVNTADGSVRWRRALPSGVPAGSMAGTILILPDSSILFSTINPLGFGPAYLVKLRGRFPLAVAPWPVDGGDLRRTRRGPVP
jgi:outer membrane protein assembly factor BamB